MFRVTDGRTDHGKFVIWQPGMAEGIFAITLLENALVADGFTIEKAKRAVF